MRIHIDTKHDMRVDNCNRGKRLLIQPAYTRIQHVGYYVELLLTKKTDSDEKQCRYQPGIERLVRGDIRYVFGKS